MTPAILAAAEKYRAEIRALDNSALVELDRSYRAIAARLQAQLDELTKQIEAAQAEGKKAVLRKVKSHVKLKANQYSADWLFRQPRYRELLEQTEAEIARYARLAAETTREQQRRALQLGLDHARALTSAAVGEVPAGVTWTFNRVPFEAVQSMIGFVGDGSPLKYKFIGLGAETAQAVKSALITGIATGRNPRVVAREVNKATDGALLNVLTTCRTETMRAYRHAAQQTYKANDDVVKGWIWSAAHQARTCAACWGMDGTFHMLDEDLVDHPNGRCVATPVTKSWEEILGKPTKAKATSVKGWDAEEKFRKLSYEEQVQVLGPTRHKLWSEGKIKLRDIPTRETSPIWGDHYRRKSLKEMVTEGKVTQEDIANAAPSAISAKEYESIGEALRFVGDDNSVIRSARHAAEAIDSVHKVGAIRRLDVRYGPAGLRGDAYGHYDRLGAPREIVIGDSQGLAHDHPMMTMAHETGHWIDDQAIGARGQRASVTSSVLDNWRVAVDNTNTVGRLRERFAQAAGNSYLRDHYDYLLMKKELFARSYAQYIATRSGNARMLSELDRMRRDASQADRQWSDEEFGPVAAAFDKVFGKLKWLK